RTSDAHATRFRSRETGGGDIGQQDHLLVGETRGNLGQVGLRIRHPKVFGLSAVYGVAEAPTPDGLITLTLAAWGQVPAQTRMALTAGGNRTDEHPITDRVAGYTGTEFFDDTHGFVTDDQTRSHRIFSSHNVEVGPADRGQRDANHGFPDTG